MAEFAGKLPHSKVAGLGFVLLLVPMTFVVTAVLDSRFEIGFFATAMDTFTADGFAGMSLASPLLLLGSLVGGLGLNLLASLDLDFRRQDNTLVGTVTVHPRLWNLAVVLVGGLLLVTMLGYAFFENLNHAAIG